MEPPVERTDLPDPSIYSFHGLASKVDARREERRFGKVMLGMGLALGLALGTALGFALGHDNGNADAPKGAIDFDEAWVEVTGHEGQVYVVDSGRWVDADDHATHTGHD